MTSPTQISHPRRALLLAAGEGSRLRPLTERCPKPMIRVGSAPILEHNVRLLRRHCVSEIAINLHHCATAVSDYFGDGSTFGVSIRYSYEADLLGTAGALAPLRDFFRVPFFLLYGDNLSDCDLSVLWREHVAQRAICTVALFWREDVSQSGVAEFGEEGMLRGFIEKPSAGQAPSHWVSAGILACDPRVLEFVPDDRPSDFGRDILPALLAAGERVAGYRMTENLLWIDSPEDYRATTLRLSGHPPELKFLFEE